MNLLAAIIINLRLLLFRTINYQSNFILQLLNFLYLYVAELDINQELKK